MLNQSILKEYLEYDADSGHFYNKVSRSSNSKIGDIAGSTNKLGYVVINLLGKRYLAHRLAWLYVYGCWPDNEIDHIDRVKSNNSIYNLRDVSRSINGRNTPVRSHSQIGHKNIKYDKRDRMFSVCLTINGSQRSFGRFNNLTDALYKRDRLYAGLD